MTARSLPPLPAALAAKLAPSPRPRPVTTQGNPYGTGPTSPRLPVAAPTRPTGARQRSRTAPRAAGARGGAGPLSVTVPLRTGRGQNNREHFRVYAKRVAREHAVTLATLRTALRTRPALPPKGSGLKLRVLLTRVSPGVLDDDNATAALKAVRDSVAHWLSIDDADPRVKWDTAQDPGASAVRIEFCGWVRPCAHCAGGWVPA